MKNEAPPPEVDDGWEWAIIEIFGHRRLAGRAREEERFGAKLLRIDIPLNADPATHGWRTHYYGGSSIFSFTPCDEATALRANRPVERPALFSARHRDPDDEDPDDGGFL